MINPGRRIAAIARRAVGLATMAAAAVTALNGSLAGDAKPGPVDAAIVFVLDRSASIERYEAQIINVGHAEAIAGSEFLSAVARGDQGRVAIAVVEFADIARIQIGWTVVDGPESAHAVGARIVATALTPVQFGLALGTDISAGLEEALALLRALPWPAGKLVVDVVGDGYLFGNPVPPRDRIVALGATINGLPLILDPQNADVLDHYCNRVIGGAGSFCLPVWSIEDFPVKLRQKLVMELY